MVMMEQMDRRDLKESLEIEALMAQPDHRDLKDLRDLKVEKDHWDLMV